MAAVNGWNLLRRPYHHPPPPLHPTRPHHPPAQPTSFAEGRYKAQRFYYPLVLILSGILLAVGAILIVQGILESLD